MTGPVALPQEKVGIEKAADAKKDAHAQRAIEEMTVEHQQHRADSRRCADGGRQMRCDHHEYAHGPQSVQR